MDLQPIDRLQPALLDRLRDDHPESRQLEPKERRVLSRNQLREAVLRDLSWLLNASRPPESDGLSSFPEVARSVINYGMPCYSGETVSTLDVGGLERSVRDALELFEPRIIAGSLRVQALEQDNMLDWHNVVSLRIEARLWAQPVPLDLLLRTDVDLETGQVEVRELS